MDTIVVFGNVGKKRSIVLTQPKMFEESKMKAGEILKYLDYVEDFRRRVRNIEREEK